MECSLVLALAALAMGAVRGEGYELEHGCAGWNEHDQVKGFEVDDDVLSWLEEIGAGELDKFGQCVARRVGHTGTGELAGLSGLPHVQAASKLLEQLEEKTNGAW